jgi:putative oxidoreductase
VGFGALTRVVILTGLFIMQRLFSAFPNSLPGAGLLLLRFCQSTLLIHHAGILSGLSLSTEGLVKLFATGAGGLILLGLFTPFVSTIGAAAALWMAIPLEERILLAAIGIGLALLGPGAWSIDALLYGRRRIDLDTN